MYVSRFNYVSDCEKDGKRILMNFLSRSCDVVDEESAVFFSENSEKKGVLSEEEKDYAAKRGYVFKSEHEELAVLNELYRNELQNSSTTAVAHVDTLDEERFKAVLEKIPAQKELILYSENQPDWLDTSQALHQRGDSACNTTLVTTGENLQYFESLFNRKNRCIKVVLIVPVSGSGTCRIKEDTESLLDTLVESGIAVEICARLKEGDINYVKPLMNYFIYKGWPFLENFTCNLEPACNEGCIFGYWYSDVNLVNKIFSEYTAHPQTEFCSMEKWVGVNPVQSLIWTGRPSIPSFHFCEASKGLTVFTGEGDVPCLNLAGKSGNFEEFRNRNASNIPQCQECVFALSCGGGCRLKERCPPVKELIELSLEYYFDEFLERLNFYEQYGGVQ